MKGVRRTVIKYYRNYDNLPFSYALYSKSMKTILLSSLNQANVKQYKLKVNNEYIIIISSKSLKLMQLEKNSDVTRL